MNARKAHKSILIFTGIFIFLSGCSKMRTDPTHAFLQVQDNVKERTGELISWENSDGCTSEFDNWLAENLSNGLNVQNVVQIALLNNPRLKATYENLGIGQADLVQAALLKNPIFSISVRFERFIESASIIETGLVQNFLDILLKPLQVKLACTELETIKAQVAAKVLDAIAEAKIAYFSMQAAEEILSMRKKILETTDAAYQVAIRLNDAGNITDLALTIQRSNFEQMKIDVSTSELEVVKAREKLNSLLGLWGVNTDWELSETVLPIPDDTIDLSCIESDVVASSLDLEIARLQMRKTALSFGLDVSEIVFPAVAFGPDLERDPGSPWFVGPQFFMGIPIFDIGLARKARFNAEISQQWNAYTALAIEVRAFARVASYELMNALKQSQYYKLVIIPLQSQVTEETHRQFNAMQLGPIELLLTKQREIETKLKSIFSTRDYWIARTEVEMLLSGKMIPKRM